MAQPCDDVVPLIPDKFDGNSSFDDWVSHFECVAAINGWNDDKRLLWIRAHMIGKAHAAYSRFSHETKDSYVLSKAALCERFKPTSNREFYKMEFRSRERKQTESWADFGDTLLLLVDRAFPDLSDDAREALALDRFMSQLNPQQVSLAVKQRKPKCVREAVDAALEVQSYLIAWHRYDREKQHNEAVREDRISTTVASSTHLQQLERIVETLKDIQLRLMNCETTQKTTQQSQFRDTSHQSHTVICRKCKQMGHYARGCAFKWQKRWWPSPPNA